MYENLLQEAQNERVSVVYMPLRGNLKALYCDQVIAISHSIDSTAEKACILAEELGHYHTTAGNILDQTKVHNRKQERRARVWSYQKLVPLDKLIQAYEKGIRSRHELAEFLGITEQFLMLALQNYKEKHGCYCRVGNHCIYFEPLGILEIRQQERRPANDRAGFVLK